MSPSACRKVGEESAPLLCFVTVLSSALPPIILLRPIVLLTSELGSFTRVASRPALLTVGVFPLLEPRKILHFLDNHGWGLVLA